MQNDEKWDGIVEIIEKAIENEIDRQIAIGIDNDELFESAILAALDKAGFTPIEAVSHVAKYFGPRPIELASFEEETISCGFPL